MLQAIFTELADDEAYYWMYAQYLDWGYFDHPPAIALFIKLGYTLFHNTLGVRLVVVVAASVTGYLAWLMANNQSAHASANQSHWLFGALLFAFPLIHIYGFVATPDAPLLLFSTLFLYLYYRFLQNATYTLAVIMGIVIAAMLYSKYHAILVLLFIVLSNLKILKKPQTWLAVTISILLFLPHVLWQWNHDFPSIKYHLIERSESSYDYFYTIEYFLNLFVIFNPLLFPLIVWVFIKYRWDNLFQKALYYIVVGTFFFFLLSSIRGHVQPQWLIITFIPTVIFLYQKTILLFKTRKYILRVLYPTAILIFILRLGMAIDILPVDTEFHDLKRYKKIHNVLGNTPVIFEDTYQMPSKYTFYTGIFATTHNNINYRQNQYDIWQNRDGLLYGKSVVFIRDYHTPGSIAYALSKGDTIYATYITHYNTIRNLQIDYTKFPEKIKAGTTKNVMLNIYNPYNYAIYLNDTAFPVVVKALFVPTDSGWNSMKVTEVHFDQEVFRLPPQKQLQIAAKVDMPSIPNTYHFNIVFQQPYFLYPFNSKRQVLTIQ